MPSGKRRTEKFLEVGSDGKYLSGNNLTHGGWTGYSLAFDRRERERERERERQRERERERERAREKTKG